VIGGSGNQLDSDQVLETLRDRAPTGAVPISAALEEELARLAPVRTREPRREAMLFVAIGVAWIALVLLGMRFRRDLHELPFAWLVGVAFAWLAGFIAIVWSVFVPRRGSMFPRWKAAAVIAVAASIGFVVLGLVVHPSGPSSKHYGWANFAKGLGCLAIGQVVALLPIIVGARRLRRVHLANARWLAAAVGAAGGCLGGLVLHLFCPIADAQHTGLVHGAAIGVGMAVGSLIALRIAHREVRGGTRR